MDLAPNFNMRVLAAAQLGPTPAYYAVIFWWNHPTHATEALGFWGGLEVAIGVKYLPEMVEKSVPFWVKWIKKPQGLIYSI